MRHKSIYFVTTPIFYVNAAPHIGHLYSALIADAVHRFSRLRGYERTVFSTGTDEHGSKIQEAAEKNKIPPLEYCTQISSQYQSLFQESGISYTKFIRTTDEHHKKAVSYFWESIKNNGHIYEGKYAGWYCTSDESFLSKEQLVEKAGADGKMYKLSAESGHPVEWTEENNFMFSLSRFQNDLLYWLKSEQVVQPSKFHKQLLTWVHDGQLLQDISVSRARERVPWGIPVPGKPDQTVYVWLEALVNYLSVIGYPDNQYRSFWPPDLHVIGKDILKFHGIYWPAFLIAAGLEPPRALLCHSHWTVNQEKMSKSKNNVISPKEKMEEYGTSGLRYFLLREATPHSDANYSEKKITNILNAELAGTLGNLLSRCTSKSLNPEQIFPAYSHHDFNIYCANDAENLLKSLSALPESVEKHYEEYNFYKGIDAVIATLHETNAFFQVQKPWELNKSIETRNHLNIVLHITMETLRVCGLLFQPIVPDLSDVLLTKLGISKSNRMWTNIHPFSWEQLDHTSASRIQEDQVVLYKRIQVAKE